MEKYDIEASLRKLNYKFVEDMTEDEKLTAVQSFKKVYAQEMSKASQQMTKRKKVSHNLEMMKKQQESEIQSISQDLNQKMANFEKNRSKKMEIKVKQHKLIEDSWRRRWETIIKKRRSMQIDNFEKAVKARKETEQFFVKRNQFLKTSKSRKSNEGNDEGLGGYHFKRNFMSSFSKEQRSASISHYKFQSLYKPEMLPTIQGKKSSKNGFGKANLTLQTEQAEHRKANEVKYDRQKYQKARKKQQEEAFQKMVNKLQRIQKNRQSAQERKQKLIKEAKKVREQKENPEKLARNRQRSLDALNMRRRLREGRQKSIQNSSSKLLLNESITQHLEAKKMIEQSQFQKRQQNFQAKFQKIKKNKIDKLVKEAVQNLKHETLIFQKKGIE